jgi:hypothetical protein
LPPSTHPGLADLVARIVADLPTSESSAGDGVTTWTRDGRPFAALGPGGIELRLDRPVAAAASRTPDVAPLPRGPEWIRFNPRELDGHTIDRLRAWLELAHRRAGE